MPHEYYMISWSEKQAHVVRKLVERELEHCTIRAEHYASEIKHNGTNIDDVLLHEFFIDRIDTLTGILLVFDDKSTLIS